MQRGNSKLPYRMSLSPGFAGGPETEVRLRSSEPALPRQAGVSGVALSSGYLTTHMLLVEGLPQISEVRGWEGTSALGSLSLPHPHHPDLALLIIRNLSLSLSCFLDPHSHPFLCPSPQGLGGHLGGFQHFSGIFRVLTWTATQ